MDVELIIFGKPCTKGSFRKGNRGQLLNDNPRTAAWTDQIRYALREKLPGHKPVEGAVELAVTAIFKRPEEHYRVRDGHLTMQVKPQFEHVSHIVRPDGDKVLRAVCDALSKHLYKDDAQVVEKVIRKAYGHKAATHIKARWLND